MVSLCETWTIKSAKEYCRPAVLESVQTSPLMRAVIFRSRTSSSSVGPYLVTADELDVRDLKMTARINGEVWTDSSTAGRQYSFADLIVHVSQSETIYPGELWGSGTATGGSGLELDRWLKPGDVVELEIEGIGILRNRIERR